MRISSITIYVLESSLPRPFGWSQGWIDKRSTTLVRVDTNAGVSGWGEGAGPATLVMLTHEAREGDVREALSEIARLAYCHDAPRALRVEEGA